MLKILRYVLAMVVILLAAHGLIAQNFDFNYIMIFFLGLMLLVMGLEDFQIGRKSQGRISIIISLFLLFAGFLLN